MGRDRISSRTKRLEKFEQNNKKVALNVLFVPCNTKTIKVAYRPEYKNKREKQVNLLMITDSYKWHYLAISNMSAFLEGKSSNHRGDFYCLNYFNSYTTNNKLKEYEAIYNKHDSCHTEMPKFAKRIIKYAHGEKSLRTPFAIYLDSECLLKEREQSRENNLEKSYTDKKAAHEPSGWAMFAKCSFDKAKHKLDYYRGRTCIERLRKKLKEHAMQIINYEKKEMITLTGEENRPYKEQEVCHIFKEKFCTDEHDENYRNRRKVKDHCHYTGKFRGAADSDSNL